MIWTVLIAVGRVGTIWASKQVVRKAFQTVTSVAVMMAVREATLKRNKFNDKK